VVVVWVVLAVLEPLVVAAGEPPAPVAVGALLVVDVDAVDVVEERLGVAVLDSGALAAPPAAPVAALVFVAVVT
jgi:hypothetical protein